MIFVYNIGDDTRIFDLSTTTAKFFSEFTPVLVLVAAGLCVPALIKLGKQDKRGN